MDPSSAPPMTFAPSPRPTGGPRPTPPVLPIFPGLVTYKKCGRYIGHAIRFTASQTQQA